MKKLIKSHRNRLLLGLVMLVGFILCLSCTTTRTPPEDNEEISVKEVEEMYIREFLNMAEVLRQIREGNAEILAKEIQTSIPVYLKRIGTFQESNMKSAGFILAGTMVKKYNIVVSPDLMGSIEKAEELAGQVLSEDCFDLITCSAPGCIAWPTSLKGANVNSPNIMGWHYIKGSHCGFSWPKFWKFSCGQPVALVPCRNG